MGCAFGLNLSELVFVLASFEIYRICAVPRATMLSFDFPGV